MIDILAVSHSCLIQTNRAIYRELKNIGWKIELLIPDKIVLGKNDQYCESRTSDDPPIHNLKLTSSHPRFSTYEGLTKLLNRLHPKIILLDNGPATFQAIQIGLWARLNKVKVVRQACDNLLPNLFLELLKGHFRSFMNTLATYLLSRISMNNIDHIFVISFDGLQVMNYLGFSDRVTQIPLGFDPKLFFYNENLRNKIRSKLGLKDTTIAYFGRLNYKKGVHILINALTAIKDLPWHFLMDRFEKYKDSYSKEIEDLIEKNKLQGRIIYFDAKHEEMSGYMNAADIVVVPSISTTTWKEQYGRVAPEAMACRKLVIVSDCGTLPELVKDTGIIFPENDVDSLTQILQDSIINQEVINKLATIAEKRAIELLSINRQKEIMNQVFETYLSK